MLDQLCRKTAFFLNKLKQLRIIWIVIFL